MLTTERFSRTNDDQEDCAEADKNWAKWKAAYKKAHAKARIRAQANEGSVKFGVANAAATLGKTQEVETHQGVDKGGMKSLEGYFDNLTAAANNGKSVLDKLVAKNTKLAATNKNLVAIVKKLAKDKDY